MNFYNENLVYWAFLFVIILTGIFVYGLKLKKKLLSLFGKFELIKVFSENIDYSIYTKKAILLILIIFLIFLSLSRPQWGTKIHKIERRGLNIIVLLDVSKSMLATDMVPNRLEKAKYEIANFIDNLKGDRIGIVIFAGEAFLQCPLTIDYGACKMLLNIVDTDSIPKPGTDIGGAIEYAMKTFPESDKKNKVMILLTDGEDHIGDALNSAEKAKKEGIIIYTIGVGTENGELIPIRDEQGRIVGYKKDKEGNPVLSKLDEVTLQKIALITKGKYYRATSGEIELKKVYDDILKMEREKIFGREFSQKEDRFQWFLLPATLLFIYEILLRERKEKLNLKKLFNLK